MASARKPLSFAIKPYDLTRRKLIVAKEEGTANSVPAAAVIPAPIAYIKVVAVKKLVVELQT